MKIAPKIAVGVAFVAVGIVFLTSKWLACWMDNGEKILRMLCNSQEYVGSFCSVICAGTTQGCFVFHSSKDLVRMISTHHGNMIIKKKSLGVSDEYIDSLLSFHDDIDQPASFHRQLEDMVNVDLTKNVTDALARLWPWQTSDEIWRNDGRSNEPNWPVIRQIMRFVHDDEYKLMQLHGDLRLFPRVLGTCGDVYAVEHVSVMLASPLLDVMPVLVDTCHAARSAGRILRYLRRLADTLPGGLLLCDLKWSHFGEAADGRVRFVDLDAAFSPARMAATQAATACGADADCHFFDCRGACDAWRGVCRPAVSDNVANLCRQLLWPRTALLPDGPRLGLLAPLLTSQQAALLERCAASDGEKMAPQVDAVLTALEHQLCRVAGTDL